MNPVSFKEMVQTSVPQVTGQGGMHGWRVFITPNEENTEKTIRLLTNEPLAGSVMLGVSGFFTLNVASVAGTKQNEKIQYIVIVDLSRHVKKFWESVETIVRKSGSKYEAGTAIVKELKDNCSEYYPPTSFMQSREWANGHLEDLAAEIREGQSWLSTDKRFERIKDIFANNRFAFVQGDISDERITNGIADALERQNLKFHAVYFSNIREYCEYPGATVNKKECVGELRNSLSKLKRVMTDASIVIDTELRQGGLLYSEGKLHLNQRTFTHFVSSNIVETVPYSPPSPETMEKFRAEVRKSFPAGVPADPFLQKIWTMVVIYNMVKFKVVNV